MAQDIKSIGAELAKDWLLEPAKNKLNEHEYYTLDETDMAFNRTVVAFTRDTIAELKDVLSKATDKNGIESIDYKEPKKRGDDNENDPRLVITFSEIIYPRVVIVDDDERYFVNYDKPSDKYLDTVGVKSAEIEISNSGNYSVFAFNANGGVAHHANVESSRGHVCLGEISSLNTLRQSNINMLKALFNTMYYGSPHNGAASYCFKTDMTSIEKYASKNLDRAGGVIHA